MDKPMKAWKNLSEPAKASIVFLAATIFLKGIVFLTTPVFTRIMSEGDVGLVGTYQSWKGIFEVFAIFSLTSAGVFNVGMSKYRDLRDRYMSNLVCLCVFFGLAGGALLYIFYPYVAGILKIPRSLVVLMTLYAVIMPAETFWITKERYEYRYKGVFFVTVLVALFSQIAAMIAVINVDGNKGVIRLFATAAVEIPVGLVFMGIVLSKGKEGFNKKIWGATLLFAIPLVPHYLSSIVLTASDRIMINVLDSEINAGIYTVSHGIGAMTTIIWGAIQGSLTPYIYDKMDKKNYEGIDSISLKSVAGFGIISVLVCLFAPEEMRILGPESYFIGAYTIPPIIGAMFISCLYNLFSTIEFYHVKSLFITFASIVAALTNIVLNYIFIPKFGFVAAGYTTFASYLVLTIMHYVNMRRIEKVDVFNCKKLFAVSAVFIVLCLLPIPLYEYNLLRYALALVILAGMYIKRRELISIFSKKK